MEVDYSARRSPYTNDGHEIFMVAVGYGECISDFDRELLGPEASRKPEYAIYSCIVKDGKVLDEHHY